MVDSRDVRWRRAKSPDGGAFGDAEADDDPFIEWLAECLRATNVSSESDVPADYLHRLCQMPWSRVRAEVTALHAEAGRLRERLDQIVVRHFPALVQASTFRVHLHAHLVEVNQNARQLLQRLPQQTAAAHRQVTESRVLEAQLEEGVRALRDVASVQDILGMPTLMETLVRQQHYDEALQLEAYAAKMAATTYRDSAVVRQVAAVLREWRQELLGALWRQLQQPIALSECIQVVGSLRRAAACPESQLPRWFLHCRGIWLWRSVREALEQAAGETGMDREGGMEGERSVLLSQLLRLGDSFRAGIFDASIQYRALFEVSCGDEGGEQLAVVANAILCDWCVGNVRQYLERLRALLEQVSDGATMRTALEQAMAGGESLGRIGLDYRMQLVPLFEEAVLRMLERQLATVRRRFHADSGGYHRRTGAEERADAVPELSSSAEARERSEIALHPPRPLEQWRPLAVFLNGILSVLNELQECAPRRIRDVLAQRVTQAVRDAAEDWIQTRGRVAAVPEHSRWMEMVRAMRWLLLPHVDRCLRLALGYEEQDETAGSAEERYLFALEPTRRLLEAYGTQGGEAESVPSGSRHSAP